MRTKIMGILNITPDSFYDGGKYLNVEDAVSFGIKMLEEGVDIIDVGGESTRPGSLPISAEEEIKRVVPVIQELKNSTSCKISIDTYKPEVAEKALESGASIINDIYGLGNEKMRKLAAENGADVIIMHMKGTPQTMQNNPYYEDVIGEIKKFFAQRIKLAEEDGIKNIIIDPGIGFGKTTEHNLEIIRRLKEFKELKKPILIGPSRKSFIGNILHLPPEERLEGTLAAISASIINGADMVRVHDVKETLRVIKITEAIMGV